MQDFPQPLVVHGCYDHIGYQRRPEPFAAQLRRSRCGNVFHLPKKTAFLQFLPMG